MQNIIAKQADSMISLYEQAKSIVFPKEHMIEIENIESYTIDDLNEKFKDIENDCAIYVISSDEFNLKNAEVKKIFEEKKANRLNYHISKINDVEFWTERNGEWIIYVGSKEKKLKQRMIEHLGLKDNARTTYSLYLKDWFPHHTKIVIKIWSFDNILNHNNKYDLLQIMEDMIWEEYKPLFGKKGATFNKKKRST